MTTRGKIFLTIIILGALGFGAWRWWDKLSPRQAQPPSSSQTAQAPGSAPKGNPAASASAGAEALPDVELTETKTETPRLAPAGIYQPKGDVVEIELSEYAGYAGLIVANGGLEPNANSLFATKYGFKLKITLSEEESWSALNSGKMAASATTVDVLAVMGRQFQIAVPALIGFSRGADGVVVRQEIKRINDLKGKTLVTAQFTEADFFIRYLAEEAGLPVATLPNLDAAPDAEKLNLVFCEDAFAAGDFFLRDLKSGANKLAGCVTWAPKTGEVADGSGGKAHILTTTKNLLTIADVLIVNKGFAQQHPDKVAGLVQGLLEGNRMMRQNPSTSLDVVGKAFKWDKAQTQAEMAKVHLANLPENRAFFSGAIDAAGSFGSIYQSALLAYGTSVIKDPVDGDRYVDLAGLKKAEDSGLFKDQKIEIAPIRSTSGGPVEGDPLLSKNIRFLFAPNSAKLDMENQENLRSLEALKRLLQVSPGSTILLRGHVDNSNVEEFKKRGGDAFVRQMAMKAISFSKERAGEIRRILIEKYGVEDARLEIIGRGWEEPMGPVHEQNRRVEAQWFTLE